MDEPSATADLIAVRIRNMNSFDWLNQSGHNLGNAEFSEAALAAIFAGRHENELRYVGAWGKWLHYRQGCWKIEQTGYATESAKAS